MANPHQPPVNFPHTGPSATQTLPANAFPTVPVSEPLSQAPLDLNFAQKVSQNPVKNETETLQQKAPDPISNAQQETTPTPTSVPNGGTPNGAVESTPKAPAERASKGGGRGSASQKSRCHWSHGEIIALFDAKKAQAERPDFGSRRSKSSTAGKWDDISDYCKSMGVKKQPSQCRDKWERLWPAFKKIMDWERQIPEGKISYWAMSEDERDREGFARQFDKEIYDAMFARFAFVAPHNMSVLAGTSPVDDAADGAVNDRLQNGTAAHEDGPSVVDDHAPASSGRKRKNPPRSCTLKKPSEGKKVYLGLEANDGTHSTKSSKDLPPLNDVPLDPAERKMVIEERKLKLAERRFVLEEKKLEATIEIGKGLIASMERMTGMISSLGAYAAPR